MGVVADELAKSLVYLSLVYNCRVYVTGVFEIAFKKIGKHIYSFIQGSSHGRSVSLEQ